MPTSVISARSQPQPSRCARRSAPERIHHAEQIRQVVYDGGYDVLSIDLFDTLVYRRCATPDRVFALQYAAIGAELPLTETEWTQLRKSAERDLSIQKSPNEAHFDEIYDVIGRRLDLDSGHLERLKTAELEAERSLIVPFLEVAAVANQLIADGITVVVNTDMYLPVAFLRELLADFLDSRAQVICSSETGSPKRTGLAYRLLQARFPNSAILHVGDNAHSDVRMAAESGVDAVLVAWERQDWLRRNRRYTNYMESLGIRRFSTPADGWSGLPLVERARLELAWRWSLVMFDFLLGLREYARRSQADEIWFLSRDCESLHAAALDKPDFFGDLPIRYVYTSRQATYPMFALSSEYERISGEASSAETVAKGTGLVSAYRHLLNDSTRRVVIVDAGWKGRLQTALQTQIPEIDFRGYYISLDRTAEAVALRQSKCFVPFDPATICGAAVEALIGYRGGSCTGYYHLSQENAWQPLISATRDDLAPAGYCAALRSYLSEWLRSNHAQQSPLKQRIGVVREICMYPDDVTARALEDWEIGVKAGGGDASSLLGGERSRWIGRLLGSTENGNLWPAAAAWSLSRLPALVRVVQAQIVLRKSLLFRLGGMLGHRSTGKTHSNI